MQEFPKLHKMLKEALSQAARDCSMLLGKDLAVKDAVSREVTRDAYFGGLENASFVVGIESQGEYQGTFYQVISLRDAVVLSGSLLGVSAARISEKKKLAIFEADDEDAFSEIANQLTGSFNAVFKPSLPMKVHLKQLVPRKFIPRKDTVSGEEPVADGEYYLVQAQLAMAGQELEQIDLLIPLQLAKLFDLQKRRPEKEPGTDSTAAEANAAVEREEPPGSVLILDDDAADRQQFQDILAASGVKPVVASLDADLKRVLSLEGVKAVLMGVVNADERELSLCIKIKAHYKDTHIPIIMCARQWTRTGVLKALKYGVSEILLKPCLPEELTAKVLKLVNAA